MSGEARSAPEWPAERQRGRPRSGRRAEREGQARSGETGGAPRVAVVGGGLAGLAAGVALAEREVAVSLFEAKPWLGGATHSFERDGLVVDNGQHAFLRCYTAYRGLLQRMGVADRVTIQDRFDVPVLAPDGRQARLRRSDLPGPAHLAGALARYSLLEPTDRLRALRAVGAMHRLDPSDTRLDECSFGSWLARHGQRDAAVRRLWDLFIVAALNAPAEQSSSALAAMVVKTALLGGRTAPDLGLPAVPLRELHGEPGARLLRDLGAGVHTKSKVTSVRPVDGGFSVAVGGSEFEADAVVLAVPHDAAVRLLPDGAVPHRDRIAGLGAAPIINAHAVFDRPVTALPFAATVDSPAQWVFDRTHIAGVERGQYLAVSVSAADDHIDRPTRELRTEFLPALGRLFPRARSAEVTSFFVTRERRATFRQSPGSRALRPPVATRLPGLLIAGAWTDTGWPDTMEGAVRSGLAAARLVRSHLSRPAREAPVRPLDERSRQWNRTEVSA